MDLELIKVLANFGGLGALAAVLFYLNMVFLKTFRRELAKEREMCHEDHEKIMKSVGDLTKAVARAISRMRRKAD